MEKRATTLVLLVTLVLTSWPLPVKAGWSQDGFAPCVLSVSSDSLIRKYLVQKGDTVWDIARASSVDVDIILAMNNLDRTSVIQEGQYLDIPGDRHRLHRIKAGDSLWKIAGMYQVSVSQLIAANTKIKDPSKLRIGQMINIPAQSSPAKTMVSQPSRSITGLFAWPVFGEISSRYGWRKGGFHHGLDIACKVGTPIRAAQAGKVTFSGTRSVYGKTVVIEHTNGIETLYAHTSKNLVTKGQQVKKGQIIALVGLTGRTTGPHLHFQINHNGKTVDPMQYLR